MKVRKNNLHPHGGFLTRLLSTLLLATGASLAGAAELWPQGLHRVRELSDKPFVLAADGKASAQLMVLSDAELVRNAAGWLNDYVRAVSGTELPSAGPEPVTPGRRYLVAAVGDRQATIRGWVASGRLHPEPLVGEQGFVVERIRSPDGTEQLVVWSPAEIGCRYGLIEVLRCLQVQGRTVQSDLARLVERPQFPVCICYVNFAEHLQNAYNPNLLFDTAVNCWSPQDWERFIDMLSAFRYNVFEFWLVPTLFSPEALQGEKIPAAFAETMNRVIAYAKRRGVGVHPILAVNTVGAGWHYHCPNDPKERAEIVALWQHWSRALKGNPYCRINRILGKPLAGSCRVETPISGWIDGSWGAVSAR